MSLEEPTGEIQPLGNDWRRWLIVVCIVVAVVMLVALRTMSWTGTDMTADGDRLVIRLSPWWMAILGVPAMLVFAMGIAIVTVPHMLARFVGVVALVGGLALVLTAPSVLIDELVVTPEGFSHTAGGWWRPETKQIRFADLDSLTIRQEERGDRPSFVLECRSKDGQLVEIPKSTVLEAGLKSIFGRAMRQGVDVHAWPVEDEQID